MSDKKWPANGKDLLVPGAPPAVIEMVKGDASTLSTIKQQDPQTNAEAAPLKAIQKEFVTIARSFRKDIGSLLQMVKDDAKEENFLMASVEQIIGYDQRLALVVNQSTLFYFTTL